MRFSVAWTIFKKELLETVRDRRTLLMAIGIPMIFYPLVVIGVGKTADVTKDKTEARTSQITVWGSPPETLLTYVRSEAISLDAGWTGVPDSLKQQIMRGEIQPPPVTTPDKASSKERENESDLASHPVADAARQLLLDRRIDAVLVAWPPLPTKARHESLPLSIYYDSVGEDSWKAKERLEQALGNYKRASVRQRLQEIGLPENFTEPLTLAAENVAERSRRQGQMLGGLLPLLLVLMSTLGSIYPSIDMTAGEKERGTLQTLLCSPITPLEILLGKLMAVWVIALATAIINLGSVAAIATRLLADAPSSEFSFSILALAFAMLLPLIGVLSALYFAICAFARDFKDAQNLVTPFYFVLSFLPAVATVPGVELTAWTAFIPIVNIALLVKALLIHEVDTDLAFLTLVASTIYGVLALLFAARVFSREQIVLGGKEPLRSILGLERTPGTLPSPAFVLVFFAVVMVLQFYGSLLLKPEKVIAMILVIQLGMILGPTIAVILIFGFPLRQTLSLRPPPLIGVIASILLGLSAWAFAAGLLLRLLPPPDSLSEGLKKLLLLGDQPGKMALALVVLALTPALCEELYFRGLLLAGFRSLGKWPALMLTALLFGILHASIYRLLPTAFLGLLMGYAVWKTGSIVSSILLHTINNGIAVVLVHAAPEFVDETTQLPLSWTFVGTGVMCFALFLLWKMPEPPEIRSSS